MFPLKESGILNQIARHLGVSRNTVYKYLSMTPDEFKIFMEVMETRKKKLDPYEQAIIQRASGTVMVYHFVLSHSRYKFVLWQDRPFTTRDVIEAHEQAFAYFGGMPKEIVYDQDHLLLISENHGDLILTHEFAKYVEQRQLRIYMCRKSDPESKGRVENVVKYVKRNFAKHRIFVNVDKLNEESLAWLERTGNASVHHTTKKIPAEVFAIEKQHLRPVHQKIQTQFSFSITRTVRKELFAMYLICDRWLRIE
ncbi:MAG: Mobile element protein [Candidatus Carbobacillus altaicus]|uniref:Mobile element protein n=1 Tax=Candidatus Carbonibacillus altaicus TaxID=2163959 RepID=A0A2R6Y2E7_9BACL|nr:MAG: Mobile element protein [Candidatus Carbobacillus altaicus]